MLVAGGVLLFEGGEFGGGFAADGAHRRAFCFCLAAARRQYRRLGARWLVFDKSAFVDGLCDLFEGLVGLGVEKDFVVYTPNNINYIFLFLL